MKCPKCGKETEPRWRVCPSCGLPLAEDGGHNATPHAAKKVHKPPAPIDCPICDGTGRARCSMCMDGAPRYPGIDTICRSCSGTERVKCPYCWGTGELDGHYGVGVCHVCGGSRKETCTTCKGKGIAWLYLSAAFGACVFCHGSGKEPCVYCMSSGKERISLLALKPGECYGCSGDGETKCVLCDGSGRCFDAVGGGSMACPDCRGATKRTCLICRGSGQWDAQHPVPAEHA